MSGGSRYLDVSWEAAGHTYLIEGVTVYDYLQVQVKVQVQVQEQETETEQVQVQVLTCN